MEQMFVEWGLWGWVGIGLTLLTLEMIVPGVFMLWFGISALCVGFITVIVGGTDFWSFHIQIIAFLFLSVAFAYYGRKYVRKNGISDQPLLNQPALQLVGRSTLLKEDIINGRGRVEFDGLFWAVRGSDMVAGTKIIVTSVVDSNTLIVDAAES
jgi:inner membrane protein